MYICINEKRHRFLINPPVAKKERNERTPANNQTVGAQPLYLPQYKISRKIIFSNILQLFSYQHYYF